jgi:hypothetical protein
MFPNLIGSGGKSRRVMQLSMRARESVEIIHHLYRSTPPWQFATVDHSSTAGRAHRLSCRRLLLVLVFLLLLRLSLTFRGLIQVNLIHLFREFVHQVACFTLPLRSLSSRASSASSSSSSYSQVTSVQSCVWHTDDHTLPTTNSH